MKQEKSKVAAYLLEIFLFPFGLSWFYLGKIIHGIIHLVIGVFLLVPIFKAMTLLGLGSIAMGNPGDMVGLFFFLFMVALVWLIMDCIYLSPTVDDVNEKIKLENEQWNYFMSGKFSPSISEEKTNADRSSVLKTKVEQREEIQDTILKNVIEKSYKTDLFQTFKNTYFKQTNHITDKKLKRSYQLLEDEQYTLALQYFEDLLIEGTESSFLYLGRCLATLEINTPEKMVYYYQSLQQNNDYRRGEFLEDEGHKCYELFNQLTDKIQNQYKATVAYNDVKKNERALNYDLILEKLTPYKDELNHEIFKEYEEKREQYYQDAQHLEQEAKNQKKASLIYQKAIYQYKWCGQYKDAPEKVKQLSVVYENQLNHENKQHKQKVIILSIMSILFITGASWAGISYYHHYEKQEAIKSLDKLSTNENYVVRKFCRENNIDPRDCIWMVNTYDYDDQDDYNIDIAYKQVSGDKIDVETTIESGSDDYFLAPTNSDSWVDTSTEE